MKTINIEDVDYLLDTLEEVGYDPFFLRDFLEEFKESQSIVASVETALQTYQTEE